MTLPERESLKRRILDLIEEDKEFRYALMGLLGYREILERISRIEEMNAKLQERMARLEERQQKLEERQQRLEELQYRLEERQQKLEERQLRLEERMARLEERMLRLEEEMRETRRVLAVIAHRFGILSEEGLREALKYVVEEVLGAATVERKVLRDDEGLVYGHPAIVEIDVVVRDDEHVIVEVKSRVSRADVAEAHRVALLYERQMGVRPRALIIGGFVDEQALELASRLGVDVRPQEGIAPVA